MIKKRIRWIGLLAISVASILATEAMAAVCIKTASGSCKFFTGSVSCEDLGANGVGNVIKDPKSMSCEVGPLAGNNSVPMLVYCSNGGGNVAPGVNATISGISAGFATIYPGQVDKNGVAKGIKVKAEPTDDQRAQLESICDATLNPNWYYVDSLPIDASIEVLLIDDTTQEILGNTLFNCHLPNPETLQWDNKAKAPERRQYECVRQ
jgi:hypothetical protein